VKKLLIEWLIGLVVIPAFGSISMLAAHYGWGEFKAGATLFLIVFFACRASAFFDRSESK